ncbi:myb-like protein L isoform X2 [Condylostylus longicornis]|uniref:myb-like protein L isoform X2 n=1 Tax=Condylostylus longicornis TaxID=2530218 RepID=UPI00244E0FA2|nr:myb-like protein L isoform X2 [Condylostylus longicornis]
MSYSSSNASNENEDEFEAEECNALLPTKDFVLEMNLFLEQSITSHSEKVNERALLLNQEMQKTLQNIKPLLEKLVQKCRAKYKHNEHMLKLLKLMNRKNPLKAINKSYQVCGIPYFKTKQKFSHPPNEDYLRRKNNMEVFPVDILYDKQNYWSLKDKAAIIEGVVEHLSGRKRNEPCTSIGHEIRSNKQTLLREQLSNLLPQCDKKFKICWYRVCTEYVKSHKEHLCDAMWNMYLKPGLSRDPWDDKENNVLLGAATDNNFQNWSKIANIIGNRSELQCFTQYFTVLLHYQSQKVTKWTPEDDEKLKKAVKKCSMNNIIRWNLVKQHFPNLRTSQLHHRYHYSVDPNINKSKFTWIEDCAILAAIEQYGETFKDFPLGLLPGRTIVQIRNRWHNTLKHSGKHSFWSIDEDKKLLELVARHGEGNYSVISSEFLNKSRCSVRQRLYTIKKFFERTPNAKIENCPRRHKPLRTAVTSENWQQKITENLDNPNKNLGKSMETKDSTRKYYNSLRSLEKKYYQIFKFSYDYSFKKELFSMYSISNLNFLVDLLKVNIDKKTLTHTKAMFNAEDYCALQKLVEYRKKGDYKKIESANLPPSWSTLLGFRGACIQCASTIHTKSTDKVSKESIINTEKGELAKNLFRKRFYTMFYKTALLSRLDCFIPHEVLLSNGKILESIAKNELSEKDCNLRKRRNSCTDPEETNRIKEIKLEI